MATVRNKKFIRRYKGKEYIYRYYVLVDHRFKNNQTVYYHMIHLGKIPYKKALEIKEDYERNIQKKQK